MTAFAETGFLCTEKGQASSCRACSARKIVKSGCRRLLECRGRCRSQPFATKERYGCGSAACRYTSAHWEVANSPEIAEKSVYSAGGQSRPPLRNTGELKTSGVGADDSVGPENVADSPEISVKSSAHCRADVGIGPYSQLGKCLRIRRKASAFRCCLLQPLRRFAPAPQGDPGQSSISSVPPTTAARPMADFFVSFSWNTSHENRIVTRMLSLSMGATTLAGPSCRAL